MNAYTFPLRDSDALALITAPDEATATRLVGLFRPGAILSARIPNPFPDAPSGALWTRRLAEPWTRVTAPLFTSGPLFYAPTPPPPAPRTYSIIYADPAWSYRDKCHAGKRGAGYKYTVTSTREMGSLPVAQLAAPACVLFMWAVFPMLPDALELIEAWGFEYKTAAFVWTKRNKKADSDFFGMGNWTRANAEICLLATRGKPKRINAAVRQGIRAPIGAHSAKPAETRDRIVQLMGDLPRVELFAREKAPGWDAWGNQIAGGIVL